MKILLLEDDYSLNESIKEMLEMENFVVDSFYDGNIAYENSFIGEYDLYILDVNVPNLDGISLLEHIKKANPNAKVFIISANINIEKIKESYIKGCDDYIKKPFDIQELLLKISKHIEISTQICLDIDLFFDTKSKKLFYKKEEIILTKNEKSLLCLLLKHQGISVSYAQIEDFVYDRATKSADAIRSLLKRLRKKLPKDLIMNSLDEGYYINNNDFSLTHH